MQCITYSFIVLSANETASNLTKTNISHLLIWVNIKAELIRATHLSTFLP